LCEGHGRTKDSLVLNPVSGRVANECHGPDEITIGQLTGTDDQPRETRLGQLRDVSGVDRRVHQPVSCVRRLDLKRVSAIKGVDIDAQTPILINRRERVTHRLAGASDVTDQEQVHRDDRLTEMERQRRIATECLPSGIQRRILRERHTRIFVFESDTGET
jgi:hypothetical protein